MLYVRGGTHGYIYFYLCVCVCVRVRVRVCVGVRDGVNTRYIHIYTTIVLFLIFFMLAWIA
jgi:hypothetical protein